MRDDFIEAMLKEEAKKRICARCGAPIPTSELLVVKRKNRATTLTSYCRHCRIVKAREYRLKHPDQIRKNNRNYGRKRYIRNSNFVDAYLSEHPCTDCGNKDIRVLEFHHVRGIKHDIVSHMISSCSIKKLQEEINKCVILCANCHRIRTVEDA